MTLEEFLTYYQQKFRKFELHALRQQNAEIVPIEMPIEGWEEEFACWQEGEDYE